MAKALTFWTAFAALLVCGAGICRASAPEAFFPRDPAVLDARLDLGARGDGRTDDTDALQRGLDMSCGIGEKTTRVLYIPNGVYRVTRTLVVKSAIGPWVYGQSRAGVVIRLDDGVQGCTSVIRTHPRETGPTSADWFMRNFRNFTVDVGNNPQADGIRWCATNSGILRNVRVTGRGSIGINSGFIDQSSPNLIQDVLVDGFETGIVTQWNWGQTLSRITIRDCRKLGVAVNATSVGIENLVVEGTPLALLCDYPNEWTWWGGVVALVGARLRGANPDGPAIRNRSVLYARDVRTSGFGAAVRGEPPGGDAGGPSVSEYLSHPARRLFGSPGRALRLPIRSEPRMPVETDPRKWLCANDYGAVPGDNRDDTAAIQKAIDEAARLKKTTVYLRGIGGPDPNHYSLEGTVRVHGSVRHIVGLGWARILGGPQGRFVVDDSSAPVVKFQHIDAFGGPPVTLHFRCRRPHTLVVESCGVHVSAGGAGSVFLTDCPSTLEATGPDVRVWARQLNPEGNSDTGLVRNNGGDLWVLGMKCEGRGVRLATTAGGRTEVIGVFIYGSPNDPGDKRPLFDVTDASLTVLGLREIVFEGPAAPVKVRERRGGETRFLGSDAEPGWIGWAMFDGSAPR